MKAEALTPFSSASHAGQSVAGTIAAAFRSVIDEVRRAQEARAMRSALSQLDDASLRDIGIATDEIPRIAAGEDFTPRAWQ